VTVSADTSYLQRRVSGSCGAGNYIRVVASDGTVTCEADANSGGDITGVTAGTGLSGGGTSGAVTLSVLSSAARVYNNAALSVGSGATAVLTFNSEIYDNDSIHSTSSNTSRLVVQDDGTYLIVGNVEWDSNTSGTLRTLGIRLGGSTTIANTANAPAATLRQNVSAVYSLTAGQYVELTVYQDSGANRNINYSGEYSPVFMMVRLP
jgi:hypothetical protein